MAFVDSGHKVIRVVRFKDLKDLKTASIRLRRRSKQKRFGSEFARDHSQRNPRKRIVCSVLLLRPHRDSSVLGSGTLTGSFSLAWSLYVEYETTATFTVA